MHALILAATLSFFHAPPVVNGRDCLPRTQTTSTAAPLRAQRLADLPDANAVLAVTRSVGGCSYQQVVGFNVSTHAPEQAGGMQVRGLRGTLIPDGANLAPAMLTGAD